MGCKQYWFGDWGVYMHRVSQMRSGQVLEVSGCRESGRIWLLLHPLLAVPSQDLQHAIHDQRVHLGGRQAVSIARYG